jgi:putative oxidoreductase
MRKWMATSKDPALMMLRGVVGVVFFAHGAQKMLGWFGGPGFSATMKGFSDFLHIPAPLALLAIAAEFFGGLALVAGLFTRVAASGIAVTMVVAAALVHLPNGFFMNWTGAQKGEGFEYHLLAIAAAAVLMLRGGGAWSLDRALARPESASPVRLAPEADRPALSRTA